ncbi:MAG TPA: SGNH/GDSL hydrolase family protein [Lacipirellulaceae bacterium]|nr:SGNH/GDSL hydrolase family protein [Lacipirellulaceae bacterium]
MFNISSHPTMVPPYKLLLVVLLCASSWPSKSCLLAADAVASPDPARFKSEIVAFEHWDAKNSFPHDAILFVGSSSIRFWQTADAFPGLPIINRGFGGSHISDVNHFADRIVFKYKPRTIVFYAGDNDIAAGKSPTTVFNDFQTFANSVHKQLPDTHIIYLPIKPSVARWKLWPHMEDVNARVKDLAQKDDHLTYVDTATALLGPNDQPRKSLFRPDGLHLDQQGYAIWNKMLAPLLAK